jgi:hypothetical protein
VLHSTLGALLARYAHAGAFSDQVTDRPWTERPLGMNVSGETAAHSLTGVRSMKHKQRPEIDEDRIDQAVLALLWLGLHDNGRAWKGFDWDAMNRLHEKGYISNPVGKAKSVVFTEEGEREAERLFYELFGKRA